MSASQSGLCRQAVERVPGVGLQRQTEVAGPGSDQVGVVLTDAEDLSRDVHDGAMLLQEVTADEKAQAWAAMRRLRPGLSTTEKEIFVGLSPMQMGTVTRRDDGRVPPLPNL